MSEDPETRKVARERFWLRDQTSYWTESDLASYERDLGIKREELRGKTILDLGSGETEKFSQELKAAGIQANVISLNPNYENPMYRKLVRKGSDWQRRSIAGIAQELPFKSDVFDTILGLYSITYYTFYPEATRKWTEEIARVLKPGGEAILAPAYGSAKGTISMEYGELIEAGRKAGVEVKVEQQPVSRILIKKSE